MPVRLITKAWGGLRGRSRAQTLVEFALISPVLFFMLFAAIDLGRLLYTYAAVASAAEDGARIVAARSQQTSDCLALQRMEEVGKGFPLQADPNSVVGNTDPNDPGAVAPATPPPGVGYIYIWPAVATAAPPDAAANCSGSPRGGSQTIRHVAVEIDYHYVPITPYLLQLTGGFTVKTVSVIQTEY